MLLRVYSFCTYIHFINFELIFVFVVGYRSTSFFCMWNSRCLSIICRKDCSFPSCSLIKNQLTVGIGVWCCTINSIWLISLSILMPLWYYFDYYTFVIHFEIEFKSTMFCFFKMIWCILGSLKFHMNFKSSLFNFVKKDNSNFGRYFIESAYEFGENRYLNNIKSSNPKGSLSILFRSSLISLNND